MHPRVAGKKSVTLRRIGRALEPVRAVLSAIAQPIERHSIAAESPRPRRATGRIPEAAKSTRPRRTADQLLVEARTVTADWTDAQVTAEGIRGTLRTSPTNAPDGARYAAH
ncbi:hypothetical protein GCM10010335_37260 [Streptomyces galbus]|nr:hypothetical protein GCM10010335_37260 [Streptomyces galbus]